MHGPEASSMSTRTILAFFCCVTAAAFAACAKGPASELDPSPAGDDSDASPSASADDAAGGGDDAPGFGAVQDAQPGTQFPPHPTPPPQGVVVVGNVPQDPGALFGGATIDPSGT